MSLLVTILDVIFTALSSVLTDGAGSDKALVANYKLH